MWWLLVKGAVAVVVLGMQARSMPGFPPQGVVSVPSQTTLGTNQPAPARLRVLRSLRLPPRRLKRSQRLSGLFQRIRRADFRPFVCPG